MHRLNVWHSGFFYLINKIPFNVALKIKKKAVWWRVYKLVLCKFGSLGKVVVVGGFFYFAV